MVIVLASCRTERVVVENIPRLESRMSEKFAEDIPSCKRSYWLFIACWIQAMPRLLDYGVAPCWQHALSTGFLVHIPYYLGL